MEEFVCPNCEYYLDRIIDYDEKGLFYGDEQFIICPNCGEKVVVWLEIRYRACSRFA